MGTQGNCSVARQRTAEQSRKFYCRLASGTQNSESVCSSFWAVGRQSKSHRFRVLLNWITRGKNRRSDEVASTLVRAFHRSRARKPQAMENCVESAFEKMSCFVVAKQGRRSELFSNRMRSDGSPRGILRWFEQLIFDKPVLEHGKRAEADASGGGLRDDGLGVISKAESGCFNHFQIIGSVAAGNALR